MEPSNLPPEVMEQIFTLLPIKSLLRFKCVSKFCCALTHDPNFVHHHHKGVTNLLQTVYHQDTRPFYNEEKQEIFITVSGVQDPSPVPLNVLEDEDTTFSFSPSVHGVISIHPEREGSNEARRRLKEWNGIPVNATLILNPSTRETLTLPFNHDAFKEYELVRNSIGFEPLSKQHKLVLLGTELRDRSKPRNAHCEVITLGTSDWRQLDVCFILPHWIGESDPTCLNGALHWFYLNNLILAFDLKSERFLTFPGPELVQKQEGAYYYETSQVHGCLTILDIEVEEEHCLKLWMLKDYDKKIWVKETILVPIPPCLIRYATDDLNYLRVLGSIDDEDGEILMAMIREKNPTNMIKVFNRRLFFYGKKAKTCGYAKVKNVVREHEAKLQHVLLYKESLVSF